MAKQKTSKTKSAATHPAPKQDSVKKPSQWWAFWSIAKYTTIAAARNKSTLAFGFLFPIAFVSVFGLLGNSSPTVSLGIDDAVSSQNPIVQSIEKMDIVELRRDNEQTLRQLVSEGEINAYLDIEPGQEQGRYSTTLVVGNNPTTIGSSTSVVRGVIDSLNLQLSGVENPPIQLDVEQVDSRSGRYIDFALPGQIGFALLSTAIFGTVFGLIFLKRTLVLKRLFATPTQPLTFLLAQGASRLFFAVLQTIVIVAFGVLAFDFFLPHGWLTFAELILMSAIGLVAFLGFGYFMAGLAKDENSANPMVNLITLPQFLLSGVFFPTDGFPEWVQPIANNLPLSYFNQAMRDIATEGMHIIDVWPYILGLFAWGGIMYILAAKTFKWE